MNLRRKRLRVSGWVALAAAVCFSGTGEAEAGGSLGRATVTQVNNDVRYSGHDAAERPAKPADVVRGDDVLRTGRKSQAELEFDDRTITRLGSNSTFTFDPGKREFQLKKGLLLFDMPKHAGGGRIITPAGTAAIEGTAGIISYRSAPKVICLAGEIRFQNVLIHAGQMFILGRTPTPVDIHLKGIQAGLLMRRGLPNNRAEHDRAVQQQMDRLRSGELELTPFVMLGEGLDVFMRDVKPLTFSSQDASRLEAWIYIEGIIESLLGLPKPPPLQLNGNDVVDHDRALIYTQPGGAAKMLGFLDTGTDQAMFATGNQDIQITGSPQFIAGSGRPFNMSAGCVGQIAITSADLEFPGTASNPFDVTFKLISIDENPGLLIRDSVVGNSSPSALGGSLTAVSLTDMVIERSRIITYGGYPTLLGAGLLDIESSGVTADALNGGTVILGAENVTVQNSAITANTTDFTGLYGHAGAIILDGSLNAFFGDNADVQAQGPASSERINVRSEGDDGAPGHIQLQATTGYVRLNARQAAVVLTALPAGTIEITGGEYYDAASGQMKKTAVLDATGNYGGGRIDLTAASLIQMTHAHLLADGPGSLPGGTIHLEAPSILINNSILSASSVSGMAGRIDILGSLSGVVTINNSSLTTGGALAGSQSGIFITGGTVNLDSYTISHINSGPAQAVITTHTAIPGLPSSIHLNLVP
jgi:FecR protein